MPTLCTSLGHSLGRKASPGKCYFFVNYFMTSSLLPPPSSPPPSPLLPPLSPSLPKQGAELHKHVLDIQLTVLSPVAQIVHFDKRSEL